MPINTVQSVPICACPAPGKQKSAKRTSIIIDDLAVLRAISGSFRSEGINLIKGKQKKRLVRKLYRIIPFATTEKYKHHEGDPQLVPEIIRTPKIYGPH